MELQRGVCSLCAENTRVLSSKDSGEFINVLPDILLNNFLPDSEFQKIKTLMKICSVCCYKIQIAVDAKNLIDSVKDSETETEAYCHFCKTEKHPLIIDGNFKQLNERLQGLVKNFPTCACPRCIFYFDTTFSFKNKLMYKFPQLASQKKRTSETQKQTDTPKRKSLSKSPPSSKRRKIFDNCFKYLQPLCNNDYHVDKKLKQDKRLYRKIAYVDLHNVKDVTVKETPKMRPVIKIKLKPKSKKADREISKSEQKVRRHSFIKNDESSNDIEENDTLNETPKSAIVSNTVPKRRVSVYIDNGENQEQESVEDKREEHAEEEELVSQETDEVSTTADQLELEEKSDDTEIDRNGVENLSQENESPTVEESTETLNGHKTEITSADNQETKEIPPDTDDLTDSESHVLPQTPSQSENNSEDSSDTESSENKEPKGNDSDFLNGSEPERKKKRVTFSDEVDE